MTAFRGGQRVVVKADNDYDRGPFRDPDELVGDYYGHVTSATGRLVVVNLSGHIGRNPSEFVVGEGNPWPFFEHELEAAD